MSLCVVCVTLVCVYLWCVCVCCDICVMCCVCVCMCVCVSVWCLCVMFMCGCVVCGCDWVCVFVLYIVVRSEKRTWDGGDSQYSSPTQTGYGTVYSSYIQVSTKEWKLVRANTFLFSVISHRGAVFKTPPSSLRHHLHYTTIITTPPSSLYHHHCPLTLSHSLSCYLLCIVSIGWSHNAV